MSRSFILCFKMEAKSPQDAGYDQRKSQGAREREALRKAAETDAQLLQSPLGAKVRQLEVDVNDIKPEIEKFKTLKGQGGIKVVGNIITLEGAEGDVGGADAPSGGFKVAVLVQNDAGDLTPKVAMISGVVLSDLP